MTKVPQHRPYRRADYWLYPWQIHAIQRIAHERQQTPSAIVRDLLTAALPPPRASSDKPPPSDTPSS